MDTADDAPQDALSMPSLHDFRDTLQAVTQTPYPPRSLFIQASSNMSLLEEMLQACFSHSPRSSDASASSSSSQQAPPVQDLLPLAVIIDCSQVASTKSLYGRILNGLSGWGRGEWNDLLRGILNWDGRLKGYSIQQNQTTKQWYIHWDYANAAESLPSKTAFSSNPTKQGGIIDRKDESFSAFLEGLKMIFELGEDHQGKKEEEQEHENETTKAKFLTRPRFVVLLNAERLSEIESIPAGQNEGTLLASFMRLGELSGKPIVPILTSRSEWLLLRPNRGATEPGATLHLPALKRQDITHYLHHTCSNNLPTSSNLTTEQQLLLINSLIDLIHQTFEPYIGDELNDYLYLFERLWPDWKRPIEIGNVQVGDVHRLIASFKNVLAREIEALGELRPLLVEEDEQGGSGNGDYGVNGTVNDALDYSTSTSTTGDTSKRMSSTNTFYSNSPNKEAQLAAFSPYTAITPSKRNHQEIGMTTSSTLPTTANTSNNTINDSLSLLSKYILISAFLASSNPSKKDLIMLSTQEDDLALSKKRKKGGALRKSPTKRNTTNNNDDQLGNNNNSNNHGPIRKKDTLVPQRMLGPKPFPLERLIAITETILPVELRFLAKSQDILQEIAYLTSLKLLLKTSTSASLSTYPSFTSNSNNNNHNNGGSNNDNVTISPFDKLDNIKLKISTILELEFVENLSKKIGFKLNDRLWETYN